MSDHADTLRALAKGDGDGGSTAHVHTRALRAGADALDLLERLGFYNDLSDPRVLAKTLIAVAVEHSPGHNRPHASTRLMTAAATLAVIEEVPMDKWMDGVISVFKMMRDAYNSPNRPYMRDIAGLPMIEMEHPGVVVPIGGRH